MTELSNAVTVLIARMESHPEDFELYTPHRAKFAGTAEALYGLVGLRGDKPQASQAYWFLSDDDKQALIEAWKKYHTKQFEKEVMECIFDDGAEEREREMERVKMKQQMYQAQQRAMIQNQMMNSMGTYTVGAQQGLLGSGGNAAQNMLGMATNSSTAIRANSFTVGNEVVDESLITKLKKWVEEK